MPQIDFLKPPLGTGGLRKRRQLLLLLLLINSLLSNPDNDIHYIQYQVLKIRPATKAYNGPNTNINILIDIIKTTFIIYIVQYII